MDMDMHHDHQPTTTNFHNLTTSPTPSHESSMSMSMSMPAVFTASTQVTILFTGWTTTSITSYILTLAFLFLLAILNRFLTAWKSQLEQSWHQSQKQSSQTQTVMLSAAPRRTSSRIAKERLSPLPRYMRIEEDEALESDRLHSDHDNSTHREKPKTSSLKRLRKALPGCQRWKASREWNFGQDGLFSVLECVKAGIGYFLMLTVMTFNIGVFVAVLGGIFVGELILGPYLGTASGWEDGACHGG